MFVNLAKRSRAREESLATAAAAERTPVDERAAVAPPAVGDSEPATASARPAAPKTATTTTADPATAREPPATTAQPSTTAAASCRSGQLSLPLEMC